MLIDRQDSYDGEERDQRRFSVRVFVSLLILFLLMMTLGVRLFSLQVGAHEHFTTLSENNRLRIEPIPPTRGLIFDRNGVLLAENRPAYQLEVTVEQADDLDLLLERLSALVDLSTLEIERFLASVRQRRPFQPVLLKAGLDDEAVARIAVARHELPGVEIEARPVRHYPLGADFAHVVGYVGRINEQDLRRLDTRNYAGTSHTGKTGVERYYEDILHGTTGHKQVEVNAQGRVIRELSAVPPVPGKDLILSIDVELQHAARDALAPHDGAVVVIDPATGEVLALVSKPGFDPNPFVNGISHRDFAALQADPHKPLFNRALSGQYPPGSTLKPIVALAGLEETSPRQNAGCSLPGTSRFLGTTVATATGSAVAMVGSTCPARSPCPPTSILRPCLQARHRPDGADVRRLRDRQPRRYRRDRRTSRHTAEP
jgi:penicillin-binding protein 2